MEKRPQKPDRPDALAPDMRELILRFDAKDRRKRAKNTTKHRRRRDDASEHSA